MKGFDKPLKKSKRVPRCVTRPFFMCHQLQTDEKCSISDFFVRIGVYVDVAKLVSPRTVQLSHVIWIWSAVSRIAAKYVASTKSESKISNQL